jgi:hypothetical protein
LAHIGTMAGHTRGRTESSPREANPKAELNGLHIQLYALSTLLGIGFTLWLVFAWSGYAAKYALVPDGWQIGGTRTIELTLIRQDVENLACASDVDVGELHCALRADRRPRPVPVHAGKRSAPHLLQPYCAVTGEVVLAADLWRAPALQGGLPASRFTAVCDYHVTGVMKSVALRWSRTGPFDPPKQTLPVGTLTNCVLPP